MAKDLLTSDFDQCFRLSSGPRARLEKDGSKMKPRGAQDELPGGVWAAPLVLSWGAPRWSWAPLGALRAAFGVVLGALAPGASRGAPGAHLGLPGGSVWSFEPLLKAPLRKRENHENRRQYTLFEVFRGPRGAKIALKSLGNRSQARLGASGRLWGPREAVLSLCGPLRVPSAWLLGRPWVAPDRSGLTATRATHIRSSPKTI